jgi:hypothetical protein
MMNVFIDNEKVMWNLKLLGNKMISKWFSMNHYYMNDI